MISLEVYPQQGLRLEQEREAWVSVIKSENRTSLDEDQPREIPEKCMELSKEYRFYPEVNGNC